MSPLSYRSVPVLFKLLLKALQVCKDGVLETAMVVEEVVFRTRWSERDLGKLSPRTSGGRKRQWI